MATDRAKVPGQLLNRIFSYNAEDFQDCGVDCEALVKRYSDLYSAKVMLNSCEVDEVQSKDKKRLEAVEQILECHKEIQMRIFIFNKDVEAMDWTKEEVERYKQGFQDAKKMFRPQRREMLPKEPQRQLICANNTADAQARPNTANKTSVSMPTSLPASTSKTGGAIASASEARIASTVPQKRKSEHSLSTEHADNGKGVSNSAIGKPLGCRFGRRFTTEAADMRLVKGSANQTHAVRKSVPASTRSQQAKADAMTKKML